MSSHVDEETISMLKEVMEDDFDNLLHTYINDSAVRIDELKKYLTAADCDLLRRTAHSLKGSSGNLGATSLASLCLQVEAQSKEGVLDGIEVIINQIETEYQEVEGIMRRYLDS